MEAVVTQEYGEDQDLDNLAQSTLAEESCSEFWARHVGSLGWVPPGVWRKCCWKPRSTYTDCITRAAGNLMGKSSLLNLAITELFSCTELLFY